MQLLNNALFNDAALRAYYRMEDNGNDSKNAYHLSGTPTYEAGKFAKAAICTSNFFVLSSNLGGLIDGSNWSIGLWYKWAGGNNDDRVLLFTRSNTNKVSGGIRYEYNGGTRRLDFWRDRNGPGTAHARYNITLDTTLYHLLVVTYDGTTIRGYYDGALVASTTQSGNGTDGTSDRTEVGGSDTTNANGRLDDAFFIAKTLTLPEIQSLYADVGAGILGLLT